jgi:hypothetical protein
MAVNFVFCVRQADDPPLEPSRRLYAARASSAGSAGKEECGRAGDTGKSDIGQLSARWFPRVIIAKVWKSFGPQKSMYSSRVLSRIAGAPLARGSPGVALSVPKRSHTRLLATKTESPKVPRRTSSIVSSP